MEDVGRLLDLVHANQVPPALVLSRVVTAVNTVTPSLRNSNLVSPDLPEGARLVDTSQHDLPSTPAASTPSSFLRVPSLCDIISGVGHSSWTPPSPRRHTNMELATAGVRKASLPEIIYKHMLLANTVCAALRRIGRETTDQKKLITAMLSGLEIKHARLRSTICKKVGISEQTVRRKTDMTHQENKDSTCS